MRILKYILLLLLLFFIGLTVFVSTQKADYNITRNKVIKTPRSTIYNFVNDFRNWETFDSRILADKSIVFDYPEVTSGQGASASWKGSTDGSIKTIFVKENDSIAQDQYVDGEKLQITWNFKDTIGGTKVTLQSKGKLDFKSKVLAFFNGGINNVVGNEFEKNLENLNKTLNFELNTFDIKVNGIVNRSGTFYLKQSIFSREKSVSKNIRVITAKMTKFFTKNKMSMGGKPFVSYSRYDKLNDVIGFSVNVPVRDSISITAGSDVQSGELKPYTAVKITLTGDYSHMQKAWKKGYDYIAKNNLQINAAEQVIEIYTKGITEEKSPSKWITEIYIPVFPKVEVVKPIYKTSTDSVKAKTVSIPVRAKAKTAAIPDEFNIE